MKVLKVPLLLLVLFSFAQVALADETTGGAPNPLNPASSAPAQGVPQMNPQERPGANVPKPGQSSGSGLTGTQIGGVGGAGIFFRIERDLKNNFPKKEELTALMSTLAELKKTSSIKKEFTLKEENSIVTTIKALLALKPEKLPKEEKAKTELIASLALDAALVGNKGENPALIAPFFSFLKEAKIADDAALALIDKAANMKEPGTFTQSRSLVESMIKTYAFKGEALGAALGKVEKLIKDGKKAPAVASVMVLNIVKQFKGKAESELAKNLSY